MYSVQKISKSFKCIYIKQLLAYDFFKDFFTPLMLIVEVLAFASHKMISNRTLESKSKENILSNYMAEGTSKVKSLKILKYN